MSGTVGYIKDMLSFIQGGFRDAREGQTSEQLHYVPDGESHSVAWVLWHAARIEDLLVNGAWQGKPEIWREGGWAEKTGLPEKGFGTGQSTETPQPSASPTSTPSGSIKTPSTPTPSPSSTASATTI